MSPPDDTPSDRFLVHTRRKLTALLLITLLVGTASVAVVLTSGAAAERWAIPMAVVLTLVAIVVLVQLAAEGRKWRPGMPAVEAVKRDEWLRANMDRATRGALAMVLVAQFPLAILIGYAGSLAQPQGPILMAALTFVIGVTGQLGIFLWLDRG